MYVDDYNSRLLVLKVFYSPKNIFINIFQNLNAIFSSLLPGLTGSHGFQGAGLEEARRLQQRCYDIDECNDGRNGGCAHYSRCINTEG